VAHRDADGRVGRVTAITRERVADAPADTPGRDELTGLADRGVFLDGLATALDGAGDAHRGVAVLSCDLDGFRVVNEGLGAAAGDEVLRRVAERMAASVLPHDLVARFGTDEFAVLCTGLTSPREAVARSERIQTAVRRPLAVAGSEVVPTLSVGIAYDDRGASRPEALVRDAEAARLRAKARGRDRAEVFDDDQRRRALTRLDTEAGLRRAVAEGRVVVHYQPVIDLRDDRVTGFEALMRWEHPERGLLAPGDFMTVAEDTGLIVELGRHLFTTACHQAVAWQQHHDERLAIFVNFSASQLRHPTVVDDVRLVLTETGIDPTRVQIELTEHALLHDEDAAGARVAALKDLGLRIAIDDFGTGYSSLSYLQRFPVDLLKVDRSFVAGVARDGDDAAIVRGVIELAHRLGLDSVAEGVETPDQVNTLRALGCERAQGYLLGRPADADTQTAFLTTRALTPHLRAVDDPPSSAAGDTGAA